MTFSAADDFCISKNGKLAEIETSQENAFLSMWLHHFRSNGSITEGRFWIGLDPTLTKWVVSGKKASFLPLCGIPDPDSDVAALKINEANEDCWNPEISSAERRFICEFVKPCEKPSFQYRQIDGKFYKANSQLLTLSDAESACQDDGQGVVLGQLQVQCSPDLTNYLTLGPLFVKPGYSLCVQCSPLNSTYIRAKFVSKC